MRDAFAALRLERRPLVDEVELEKQYLLQAALLHPDSTGGDARAFAELGIARGLLEDPAQRLSHLIELEGGTKEGKEGAKITPSSMGQVAEIMGMDGVLLQATQEIAKIHGARTSLAKAVSVPVGRKLLDRLEWAEEQIGQMIHGLQGELADADRTWPRTSLIELARIATAFRFVQKRKAQVSETLFQLRSALRMF